MSVIYTREIMLIRSACELNLTFRLIDDITSINSDDVFEKPCAGMYPRSFILNKENSVDSGANVLDLTTEIGGDSKFKVSVYDKKDSYKFNVIRFPLE